MLITQWLSRIENKAGRLPTRGRREGREGGRFKSVRKMEGLEPKARGPERDHGDTPEAQKARSIIICKYHGVGLRGTQVSIKRKDHLTALFLRYSFK